jgi:hypothetical protein
MTSGTNDFQFFLYNFIPSTGTANGYSELSYSVSSDEAHIFSTNKVSLTAAAVPEPATWAMMLFGFGGIGYSMRRKRSTQTLAQIA